MKKSRQVALVLGCLFLGRGFALGQGKLGPYVVDSNGLKVGRLNNEMNVFVFINGELSTIAVGRNGLTPLASTYYYQEADCAGTAYLEIVGNQDVLYATAFLTTDGVIHYVSMASADFLLAPSARSLNVDGSLGPCLAFQDHITIAPALTVPAPAFTPPFHAVEFLPVSAAPAIATFNDVPTNHPFFRFIEALVASGITAGCGSGNYCPDTPLTRGQMAVFLAKALGL